LLQAFTRFQDALNDLTLADRKYMSVAAGVTASKHNAADTLAEQLIFMTNALYVLGRNSGNESLKAENADRDSSFRHLRDTELSQKATRILELVRVNESGLSGFGIDPSRIQQFADAASVYHELIGQKENKKAESKASREGLFNAFNHTDDVLKQDLDCLIELLREKDKDFYNQYHAARAIKDLGLGRKRTEQQPAQAAPVSA
jgi:hypothetical protein